MLQNSFSGRTEDTQICNLDEKTPGPELFPGWRQIVLDVTSTLLELVTKQGEKLKKEILLTILK